MEKQAPSTINERILELVEDMEGPSEVARLMGINPQFFYNLKNRPTSKPNSESLEKFFEVAPRANANYIYKGIGPKWLDDKGSPGESLVIPKAASTSDPETGELRAMFIELQNNYNVVVKQLEDAVKYNTLLEKVIRRLDPSFNESGSHTTAQDTFGRLIVSGFQQKNSKAALAGKVMAMYPVIRIGKQA
jgi:hypothetical protein